jgi:hypothetical protein
MPRTCPALLLALATAAACRAPEPPAARDSLFAEAMIELRRHPGSTPADNAARRAALARRRLTDDSLAAMAAALARDPERAARVWRRIEEGGQVPQTPAVPEPPSAPPVPPPRSRT